MASPKRTILLVLLLISAAASTVAAWSRLDSYRSRAAVRREDLSDCRMKFATIDSKSTMTGGTAADEVSIDRRLARAATSVSLDQQLASTDFGNAVRISDSNFTQTPVYVRLNAVSMKQMVGFLLELSAKDNAVRTTDIDLTPPLVAAPGRDNGTDLWTADVTLDYVLFSPKSP